MEGGKEEVEKDGNRRHTKMGGGERKREETE